MVHSFPDDHHAALSNQQQRALEESARSALPPYAQRSGDVVEAQEIRAHLPNLVALPPGDEISPADLCIRDWQRLVNE